MNEKRFVAAARNSGVKKGEKKTSETPGHVVWRSSER